MLPGDGTPEDDETKAALANAWANYRDARRKRKVLHDIVRLMWGDRVPDNFDDRMRQSMDVRQAPW